MSAAVRVGLVDDGVHVDAVDAVVSTREFARPAREPTSGGHGSTMAVIITAIAPSAALYDARVFAEAGPATPAALAAALDWLVEQQVALVNISLGLRDDRDVLQQACARAVARDLQLVAAAPARGGPVYPSAYPGVLQVTGDARCAPGEFSWLETEQATVGACVGGLDHQPGRPGGGASCATAHVTGELASMLEHGVASRDLLSRLHARCTYHGRESRAR